MATLAAIHDFHAKQNQSASTNNARSDMFSGLDEDQVTYQHGLNPTQDLAQQLYF